MQNARMSDAVADLGTQLKVHQAGRRAESQGHTNQRRNPDDQLLPDEKNYAVGDGDGKRGEGVVIQSKNFKQRGGKREIRAPSCGSSGSQPRVVVSGSNGKEASTTGSGHLSVQSSGAQRRYDSIEHQRQSKIEKYLLNQQDQQYMANQEQQLALLRNQKHKGPGGVVAGFKGEHHNTFTASHHAGGI